MHSVTMRRRLVEKLFAAGFVAVGVAAFVAAGQLPPGGDVYPRLIAVIMTVLGVSEFLFGRPRETSAAAVNEAGEAEDRQEASLATALRFFAVLIGMTWLMTLLGYVAAGALGCLLLLMLVFRERSRRAVLITGALVALTAGLSLLFGIGLPEAALW